MLADAAIDVWRVWPVSANERERRENKKKRKSRDVTCVCTVYYVQKKVELFSTWVDH